MEGKTQQTAAAMAGMSERSARKWQCGPLPSETRTERRWRTRPDPFDGVWLESGPTFIHKLRGVDVHFHKKGVTSRKRTVTMLLAALSVSYTTCRKGGILNQWRFTTQDARTKLHRLYPPIPSVTEY